MSRSHTQAHSHRSKPAAGGRQSGPEFSLLRAGVPARLGVVAVVSAVLWIAVLWALA